MKTNKDNKEFEITDAELEKALAEMDEAEFDPPDEEEDEDEDGEDEDEEDDGDGGEKIEKGRKAVDDEEEAEEEEDEDDDEEEEEEDEEFQMKYKAIKKGGKKFYKMLVKKAGDKGWTTSKGLFVKGESGYVRAQGQKGASARRAYIVQKGLKESKDNPVIEALDEEMAELRDAFKDRQKAANKILKGIAERIEAIGGKVDKLSATPNVRKSAINIPYVERFEKAVADGDYGKKVLSVREHRPEIVDMMDGMAFTGDEMKDEAMANAMAVYESSGVMTRTTKERIEKACNVEII